MRGRPASRGRPEGGPVIGPAMRRRACSAALVMALTVFASTAAAAPAPHPVRGERVRPAGWAVVPTPAVGSESQLDAIAFGAGGDAWAVGASGQLDVDSQTLAEHWTGRSWTVVPTPNPAGADSAHLLDVAAIGADDVLAVGHWVPHGSAAFEPLVERWDGAAWSVVATPTPPGGVATLEAVAARSPRDVWVVGSSSAGTLTEHWDGAAWTIVPSPNAGVAGNILEGVAAVASNDVWAAGSFLDGSLFQHPLLEHWDGTRWSIAPLPSTRPGSGLFGVAAVASNDVWAVGFEGPGNSTALIEHWDGSAWRIVPSPAVFGSALVSVAAISSADVWAVGAFINSQHQLQPLAEHWDGASWATTPTPTVGTESRFLGVAATSRAAVAVGWIQFFPASPQTLAEVHLPG